MIEQEAHLGEDGWTEFWPAQPRPLTEREAWIEAGDPKSDPRTGHYGAFHRYTGLERQLIRRISALEALCERP